MITDRLRPPEVLAVLRERRAIPIVRAPDQRAGAEQCARLLDAGASIIEVTFTTPGAAELIDEVTRRAGAAVLVGAGTVLDGPTAETAIEAGAQFLLAPSAAPDMVRAGRLRGVATVPGAFTPSEAVAAMELGATAVKLFPALSLGVGGLRAIRAALPQIPFVPTGGITLDDAAAWLDAGALAIGFGSSLAAAPPDDVRRALTSLSAVRVTGGS